MVQKGVPEIEAEYTVKNEFVNEVYEKLNKDLNAVKKSAGVKTAKVDKIAPPDFKEPPKPPVQEPPSKSMPPPPHGKIYNNDAILTGEEKETGANITPELRPEDTKYQEKSNKLAQQEAQRIVASNPLSEVDKVVRESNDMKPILRRALAMELAITYSVQGNNESSLDMWNYYKEIGGEQAAGTQFGNVASNDPRVQTAITVMNQNKQNQDTRNETHADGQTTGKKLDDTEKQIKDLSKRFGVEVSELDSIENVIDKILVKGVPKSERLAAAEKRVKDSKQKVKDLWAASKNVGVIYDFEKQAGKQVALDKAIIEVVRAVVDEFSIRTGQKVSEVIDKIIQQVTKILGEIGIELRESDLRSIIDDVAKVVRPYSPPITLKEREDAGRRIVEQILGPAKQGKLKPAIQEFYDRVVKRMVGANPKLEGKSKEDIMREVIKNLDKYADVLTEVKNLMESQGIDTKDINSIFELPYFEKQIQKKVAASEIKAAIKEHYDLKVARAQSLADKLINEYGLSGKDAKALEKIVHEEFATRMKEASAKELTKLYGTSTLKQPRPKPKTDAEKLTEAINMGAFSNSFYSQLVAQKFGIVEFTPENISKMEQLAERVSKLPDGEVRDRAFQEYNEYIDSLENSTLAYKMFAFAKDYWRTSVLSGYTTWARMIKGSFLTAPVHITLSVLSNPKATLMSGRAMRAVIRGWKAGGWSTFKRIMFSGENTFDGENRSPRGYLQKLKTTSLRDLINNPERSALGKSADVALKFFVKPLTYTVNSAAAIETTMFRYPLKELETYYAVYNEMVKRGMKPKEQAFWDAVDKAMAVDQPTIDEAQARLNDEMDILRASGEKIPEGYENRRLHQIIEGKRDVNIVKYAADKANSAVLMNQPGGYAGWVTRGLSELGTADKDVGAIEATASYLASLPFAFVRVATSQLNTGAQFIPVMGYLYNAKNTVWEAGGKKSKQTRDKTADEQRRVMAAQVIGTTVMTAFAMALFDWEWDDEDKDAILPKPKFKKDSRIRVTGMGLGAGKYSENKQIAPDYKEMSIQFQYSDGTWSDPYSYRDSPIGMIIYPLGQISDEIRFKEFKNKTDQENTDRTNSALLLSAANQTWNFAMSQSYMTGINGMVDIIGFSGSDRDVDILLKAVTSPVAPFVMPNLYKQTYQQVKAFTDTPDRDIRGVFKKPMQDIPIIEEYVGGERTDMFGYPMVRKFEIPLVPDYLLVALKENRDYRLGKKEWQLLYKYPEVTVGMPFKAPVKIAKKNFFDFDFEGKMDKDLGVKKMPSFDDKDYVKLTDDQKLQWEESAKNYFKEEINNSYDVLNKNSTEMLQYNLNTLKSKAKARASMEVAPKSILERLGRGKGRNAIDVEFPVYK